MLWLGALQASTSETATFAGGCFWCVEEAFDQVDGVLATTSGYANGRTPMPSYEQVSGGGTGYVEAVRVEYDPARVRYERLLDVFWHHHDPTDAGGQFCDRGEQYRPAIFYETDEQRRLAQSSAEALRRSKPFPGEIRTAIEPLRVFHPAEKYHQDYYAHNPLRYGFYKYSCGREARLDRLWGNER